VLEETMHLDEGTIHAWLDGALDADEASRVEQHAAECATCAAAVAEARGLVAGASRILTALDSVPGGVVPKAATGGSTMRERRTRSLWTTLHLTPARAAAAAVVVLAAGSALVLRNAPNAARSATQLAGYVPDTAPPLRQAAPIALPLAAPDTAAVPTSPAQTERASARVKMAEPVPKPVPAARRAAGGEGAVGRAGSAVAVAEKARPARVADELAVRDSLRLGSVTDSIAARKEVVTAQSAAADNAVRGGVAGAAPRAAAAAPPPSRAAGQRYAEAKMIADVRSTAGCYDVIADSAAALPPRLWLDSSLVAQPALLQRSRASADASVIEKRVVSAIGNDTRRSIAGGYWVQRTDGSIRLSLPAIGLNVDLLPASASTFVGAAAVGDRSVSVTLRRANCSP
jgi:hypothetical protein